MILVLLYDSRFQKFPGKFKIRWLGPYRVIEVFPNGSIVVADLEGAGGRDCLKNVRLGVGVGVDIGVDVQASKSFDTAVSAFFLKVAALRQ